MKEDESLYNAIIIALAIGIVVVIITLFLTKPAPESFSELYFNDHLTLPEFVSANQTYNYTFTITNHENKLMSYNYTIDEQLYAYDLSCEKPDIYLEEKQNSSLIRFTSRQYNQSTRATNTEDPRLIIKEPSYNATVSYKTKSGEGQIALQFVGVDKKIKYIVIVNEERQQVILATGIGKSKMTDVKIQKRVPHTIKLIATPTVMTLMIDGKNVSTTDQASDYTKGFLQLETTSTYADITGFNIERRGQKEVVNVRYGDVQLNKLELEKVSQSLQGTDILQSEPNDFETITVPLNYTKTVVQQITTSIYSPNDTLNLTEYSLESSFRLVSSRELSMGVRNSFEITLNATERKLYIKTKTETKSYNITRATLYTLTADIYENRLSVYFNGKYINTTDVSNYSKGKPYIETTDKNVLITRFEARSNTLPQIVQYKIPQENTQVITYTSFDKDTVNILSAINTTNKSVEPLNISDDIKQSLLEQYNNAKITWQNYTIYVTYIDQQKKGSVNVAISNIANTVFSVNINDSTGAATITYPEKGRMLSVTNATAIVKEASVHWLLIDVNMRNVTVISDGNEIFYQPVQFPQGAVIVEETKNVTLTRAEVDNSDSYDVKILRSTKSAVCKPILKQEYIYAGNSTIPDRAQKTFKGTFSYREMFDIAKVMVTIKDSQEIHFMVKQI